MARRVGSDGARTEAAIRAAALRLIARHGYEALSMRRLAREVGLGAAALYRYFPSKRNLYLAVLEEASPRLLQIWERAFAEAGDPLQGIWDIGMAYYDHATGRAPMMRLWFQALSEADDPDVRAAVGETLTGAVDVITANIEDGKARGLVKPGVDARVAAWHFMGIGLMFDLLSVLGLPGELDRATAENWGRFFIESIRQEDRADD